MRTDDHTFVICAYKESQFLEDCIQSLLEQTVQSKIIISTATPNAHISNLAKKYQLSVTTHSKAGIGIDWNAGLNATNTKYVTLAHQDDIYLPEFLEESLNKLTSDTDSLIAFTDYLEKKDGTVLKRTRNLKIKRIALTPIKYFPKSVFMRNRSLSLGNSICCPAVTYNMSNLKAFQFDLNFTSNLDWEAWYRISKKKGSFLYVDKPLMYHRIHEESETSNAIQNNKRTSEDEEMFRKYWPNGIVKLLMKFYIKSQETN
ncbi:glycosyltransferase family 2 protein [Carnobacterium mobile]|uniref:glycosyltransferase family 2 protein n=1 Tax=Carnobacterium mobile TaxID=2750 RepID=UPI001868F2DF|nr:glycosyltransferase [Carnobacterium mobile]